MAPSTTPEYPPLLPLGFHPKTAEELEDMCVTPFPLSSTRSNIMNGLRIVISRLAAARIAGELWINGSFLTEKIDPRDSDVVLAADNRYVDIGCTLLQGKTLDWISSNLKAKHLCDSYVFFNYPKGHAYEAVGEWMRAYWIKQFGFSRSEQPKGIAVFKA